MITETKLENGLVERKSDRGVYIKNVQTGHEYSVAIDITNDERIKQGLQPYSYVETERAIKERVGVPAEE